MAGDAQSYVVSRCQSSGGKPKHWLVLGVCSCDGHVFTEQSMLISVLIYSRNK